MFEKISALFGLLRVGSAVADAGAWKQHQMTATIIGTFIMGIANVASAFGHPLPITIETANVIGGGILAAANVVLTAATSERAGLLPAPTERTLWHDTQAAEAVDANTRAVPEVPPVDKASYEADVFNGIDTTYLG